ncbi:hypothetical protein ACVISU_004986 [Bradyrhizobium sp. USDA 4452]
MRPTQLRPRAAVPAFFVSCKCEIEVPVRQPLLRHALEQAALDPSVRAIRYRTGPVIECPPLSLHGVVLDRVDGRFLLRVYETRPERGEDQMARIIYALERYGPAFARARSIRHQARAALYEFAHRVVVCPASGVAFAPAENRSRPRRRRPAVARGVGRAGSSLPRHCRLRLCPGLCRSGQPQYPSPCAGAGHCRLGAIANA